MKTVRNISLLLLLFVFLTACQSQGVQPTGAETETPDPTVSASEIPPEPEELAAVEEKPDPIAEKIAQMTLEEKCGQMLIAGIEGTVAGVDATAAVSELHCGGIILFRRNVASAEQVSALNQALANMADIPLFLCVDEEGGRVSRLPEGIKKLPAAKTITADFYETGYTLGETLGSLGYNVNFAPILDVLSNPNNTVIGDRAFGVTAAEVTEEAIPFAHGLAESGVMPVVKHFPGHGDTDVDSHTGLPLVKKTMEELETLELAPFRAAIEEGLPAVMVAHVVVEAVDSAPATLSYPVVTGLLREELGFEGLIFTDDLTMGALSEYPMGEIAVLAVEAGCDMLLVCHGADRLREAHTALVAAVNEGRIPENRIDESLFRILREKENWLT